MKIALLCFVIGVSGVYIMAGSKKVEKKLEKYQEKRDFTKSKEPQGESKKSPHDGQIFVIQKHDASHLHYDFRLSIDGVLVSWAVPKGPSLNPTEKRLAIQTEDHPLEYAQFEGVIPQGEYGGGTVMIWDTGTYTNIKEVDGKIVPMSSCLKDGRIEIFLKGSKLRGGFALVKVPHLGEKNWLLIKMNDEYASKKRNPVSTQKKSAVSDKTMYQIRKSKR